MQLYLHQHIRHVFSPAPSMRALAWVRARAKLEQQLVDTLGELRS